MADSDSDPGTLDSSTASVAGIAAALGASKTIPLEGTNHRDSLSLLAWLVKYHHDRKNDD